MRGQNSFAQTYKSLKKNQIRSEFQLYHESN